MTDDQMLEELRRATEPRPPRDFRPGVIYSGRYPSEIVTPPMGSMDSEEEWEAAVRAMGVVLPAGMTLALVEAQYVYHDAFWKRDGIAVEEHREGIGEAYTDPSHSWRYRFKVVPKSARSDVDIAALMEEVRGTRFARPRKTSSKKTKIISLADFQVSKTDELGGTRELLERSERALREVITACTEQHYAEVVLIDAGDSTEGFNSAPNAERTNDLSETESIRVWRRILWRWIEALAPLAPRLVVVGVPSNHCRVRRGKAALGDALDDWGIEVISQVSDIAKVSPSYKHVSFVVPEAHAEHVLLPLVGGLLLGVAHGHQKNSVHQLAEWVKGTSRREGLANADIVIVGHFHHLEVKAFGDGQYLFVSPTNDNGSSWFTPSSGERSRPGVLTIDVNGSEWTNHVVWTA